MCARTRAGHRVAMPLSARPARPDQVEPEIEVGVEAAVIGGTGFYAFLDDAVEIELDTPYGAPSAAVSVGTVSGRRVAFLPRHGKQHEFPPHAINYRANLWALRSLGVRQVLAPSAVGGLAPTVAPGDLVVPDQLVDRTWRRIPSYVEQGATHVPLADPYCDRLRGALSAQPDVGDGGTLVVIEGPRFSTRAESRYHAAQGWSLVGMTGAPEAALAREMRMCYAALCLVTDMDAGPERGTEGGPERGTEGGPESGTAVGEAEVYARFAANLERLTGLLSTVIETLPAPDGCSCAAWADGLDLAYEIPSQPRLVTRR